MTKSQINKYLSKLDWLFGLQHYDKELIIKEKDKDDKLAEIITDHKYQNITVEIYPLFFKEKEEQQKKILLHELCHTITADSRLSAWQLLNGDLVTNERLKEINEQTTSKIENIIWGFLNKQFNHLIKDL